MRIISIDPGYERIGIAIIEKNLNEKEVLLHSECFITTKDDKHGLRLSKIQQRIEQLISEFKSAEVTDSEIRIAFSNVMNGRQ